MKTLRFSLSLLLLLTCTLFILQEAKANSNNIFADINPALEGPDFDISIESIVQNALDQGTTIKQILTMAMDNSLEESGLKNEDVIISTLIALLKSTSAQTTDIELASQELMIPSEYLRIAKEDAGADDDVAYTEADAPAPAGPGDIGAHSPPEPIASPSRP
ncbi:MAG: hypothetical protein OEM02_02630 [Desulfobulbaceae bacterium]|nr:hypothetical protein [Desulfobulbaceae bacterium]